MLEILLALLGYLEQSSVATFAKNPKSITIPHAA